MSQFQFQIGQGFFKGDSCVPLTLSDAEATSFASVPTTVTRAFCTLEGGPVRYRYCGTAPTVDTGHLLADGMGIIFYGNKNISQAAFIATSGATATLTVTYEVDGR